MVYVNYSWHVITLHPSPQMRYTPILWSQSYLVSCPTSTMLSQRDGKMGLVPGKFRFWYPFRNPNDQPRPSKASPKFSQQSAIVVKSAILAPKGWFCECTPQISRSPIKTGHQIQQNWTATREPWPKKANHRGKMSLFPPRSASQEPEVYNPLIQPGYFTALHMEVS